MYLATEFNKAGLFKRAGAWAEAVPIDPSGRRPTVALLLHRASAAYLHLERINILHDLCRKQFEHLRDRLTLGTDRISFWSPAFAELLFELSPFFGAMVVLQNSLLDVIGDRIGRRGTLPSSLRNFIERSAHYPWFDSKVLALLRFYWDQGGETLRQYRDIDQHFYVFTQHAFLDLAGEPKIRIFLPDNPESKSPRQFTFHKEVDALSCCPTEFQRLHDTIEAVAEVFGFAPSQLKQPFFLYQPYDVVPLAARGESQISTERVVQPALREQVLQSGH
jgi:hypothetical protein